MKLKEISILKIKYDKTQIKISEHLNSFMGFYQGEMAFP